MRVLTIHRVDRQAQKAEQRVIQILNCFHGQVECL